MQYVNGGIKKSQNTTKPCKMCLVGKRYGNLSICYGCHRGREKTKRELKAKARLLRKVSSKKFQKNEWKKWHNKAWNVFSEYVRRKNADWKGMVECFTCYKLFHWKELHAGHFKHGKLDFDTMNVNPQCPFDNTYNGGKLDIYAIRLVEIYGLEAIKDLEKRANTKIYTLNELKEVFEKYSQLISEFK